MRQAEHIANTIVTEAEETWWLSKAKFEGGLWQKFLQSERTGIKISTATEGFPATVFQMLHKEEQASALLHTRVSDT